MDLGSVDVAHVRIKSRKDSIALQEHCAQCCTAPFRAPELFDPPSDCLITEGTDIW
jgi:serine/threonine kinase 16